MADLYQATYDAVRSKISGGNIGDAAERAMREAFDLGNFRDIAIQEVVAVSHEQQRPSVMFRPKMMADGTAWCALYGEDLQSGVCGFGDTPDEAMRAFDLAWWKGKTPAALVAEAATPTRRTP